MKYRKKGMENRRKVVLEAESRRRNALIRKKFTFIIAGRHCSAVTRVLSVRPLELVEPWHNRSASRHFKHFKRSVDGVVLQRQVALQNFKKLDRVVPSATPQFYCVAWRCPRYILVICLFFPVEDSELCFGSF